MALREEMLAMLDNTSIKENFGLSANLLMAISFATMKNVNIYIWAERDLHTYVRMFKSWDLHVHKVVCVAPKEFQRVDDAEIISPADLLRDMTPKKFFFVDVTDATANGYFDDMTAYLKSLNPPFLYLIHPAERQSILSNWDPFDTDSMFYYQSHKADLMELFDTLADETSKRTLYYYVETYLRNCTYRGEHNPTRYKYFFGDKYERLYKHLDGECWINCGANSGDTIFAYFSFDFKPKKVYAFEGDKETFDAMLKNLEILSPEMHSLVEPINEMIDETTDFKKILAGNKCTLLNADIEGAELKLLHAMKNVIQADRPVLAICVYHYKEDILSVPQFIQSICTDYIYYLRKYTPWHFLQKQNHEMVLYAVPKERAM